MGNLLSAPKVEKQSTSGENDRFYYGATSMQGWRLKMEDAHTTVLRLTEQSEVGFFAVFDGHWGDAAAKYCGDHFHEVLSRQPALESKDYNAAIKATYLTADEELKTYPPFEYDPSGCTAVSVLITPDDTIYCGNAGDSRCVLSSDGKAQDLSRDHQSSLDPALAHPSFSILFGTLFSALRDEGSATAMASASQSLQSIVRSIPSNRGSR